MYRSHLYVSRQSYITPLRKSIPRVGDPGGLGERLDSLYRSNLANETAKCGGGYASLYMGRGGKSGWLAPGVNR